MLRLRIAAPVIALVALVTAPAAAQATVTQTQITSWVSTQPGTPANDPYLISFDNLPTKLTVSGVATATSPGATVNVVCFYGSGPSVITFATGVPVDGGGRFTTPPLLLERADPTQNLAGHACRLRAVPSGSNSESAAFTGPQIAVSEVKSVAIASGPNADKTFSFYLNGTTLDGFAAWSAAGTPGLRSNPINPNACGGPVLAPIDTTLNISSDPPLSCVGSLLSDDLGAWGGRSEVQIDGRNAYDAASAQALFPARSNPSTPASQDLEGFPNLSTNVTWDPTSGLVSSSSTESWAACDAPNEEQPTFATCPSFVPTGVQLTRDIATSDAGRVVTMTDTWSSTDGQVHTVDLLYDDYTGVLGNATGDRGYEFPGQASFSQYGSGEALAAPTGAPGSIFVRTNVTAADGDPNETAGAITFGTAPSGFRFASNNEVEERQVLVVPAGGIASLSYIYSVGYSVSDVTPLALAAQDRFQGPSIAIGSPPSGTTVTTPAVTLSGLASAGSGITSLVVNGQAVQVGPTGAWTAQVPLSPGTNTITAVATDGAGATAQAQLAVTYNPPPPPPVARCKVPKTKGMKLSAAEKAIRKAHCKVGKIKWVKSRRLRHGRVMKTTPRAGHVVLAHSKIELFVSKGR